MQTPCSSYVKFETSDIDLQFIQVENKSCFYPLDSPEDIEKMRFTAEELINSQIREKVWEYLESIKPQ